MLSQFVFSLFTFVAATIVLSSTAGAAERVGDRLGEFVNAGDHEGRPYFKQRHTEGSGRVFMYSEKGVNGEKEWFVSNTLGGTKASLWNKQNTDTPPSSQWLHWDGSFGKYTEDTSLTLEFTSFSPICQLVRVEGKGEVVEKVGSSLGDYRSEYPSVSTITIQRFLNLKNFFLPPTGWRKEAGAQVVRSTRKMTKKQNFFS